MNLDLLKPFFDEEIKEATWQLGDLKAPGPDGFPGCFFKKYWITIGAEVCDVVRSFISGKHLLKDLNKTFVALIPKTENPEDISQFRPIGLCNFFYKIISKSLANRMKPLMDVIISDT
jgi:hypothetical protein